MLQSTFVTRIDINFTPVMAHLHCRRPTQIQVPNPIATLYYAEHVHIAKTRTLISTPYFRTGQESESESVSGNVNEALVSYLNDFRTSDDMCYVLRSCLCIY